MSDKIMTLHPAQKAGVNIDREKYNQIKDTILDILDKDEETTFKDLIRVSRGKLAGTFEGSVSWYITTVKLDLEARGLIERIGNKSPQRLKKI